MRTMVALLAFWVAFGALWSQAQQPAMPKELKKARAEFAAAMKQADSEFAASSKSAAEAFKKHLKELVEKESKAGNLDTAIAIREELKKVDADVPAAKAEKTTRRWIPGRWHVRFHPSNTGGILEIRPDGQILDDSGNKRGQLRILNDEIIRDSDGVFERFNFSKNRLFIEHYSSRVDLERNVVDQIGVAVLILKK